MRGRIGISSARAMDARGQRSCHIRYGINPSSAMSSRRIRSCTTMKTAKTDATSVVTQNS
jgi:hypothetical protein